MDSKPTHTCQNNCKLLTREQAASFLNIAPQTLAVWKCTGRYNLPVIKVGRAVRYRTCDLEAFVSSNTQMYQH